MLTIESWRHSDIPIPRSKHLLIPSRIILRRHCLSYGTMRLPAYSLKIQVFETANSKTWVFSCVHATKLLCRSVHRLVHLSVGPSLIARARGLWQSALFLTANILNVYNLAVSLSMGLCPNGEYTTKPWPPRQVILSWEKPAPVFSRCTPIYKTLCHSVHPLLFHWWHLFLIAYFADAET